LALRKSPFKVGKLPGRPHHRARDLGRRGDDIISKPLHPSNRDARLKFAPEPLVAGHSLTTGSRFLPPKATTSRIHTSVFSLFMVSSYVRNDIENFKFRNQLQTLSKADAIATLINKFLDPDIDLSPAGIDNHSMGTVFEELVRKFNEENNEEAGEHWTPRDAVRLMANLVFLPIEGGIKSGTYLLYDCACGTGGMLTVAEETLRAIGAKRAQHIECPTRPEPRYELVVTDIDQLIARIFEVCSRNPLFQASDMTRSLSNSIDKDPSRCHLPGHQSLLILPIGSVTLMYLSPLPAQLNPNDRPWAIDEHSEDDPFALAINTRLNKVGPPS
jgi:hypothetical protein